ncbi:hypothetical protein HK100_011686 [Physocladia obscura]|uniref:Uncharacterized protein n=1 Tax=Physocladia obscura TaxID=109957 RepID=A0AAD5XGT1_9FUNG|nr:hypothetical protein HK100_011686 [Physocladia obscura]
MESRLQDLKASVIKKDWNTASYLADKILIDQDTNDSTYIQMCYAQAMILVKLDTSIDEFIDLENTTFKYCDIELQDFRNAISFLIEGFRRAIAKKLYELVFIGVSCFLRLSQDFFKSGKERYLFSIPLHIVVHGLTQSPDHSKKHEYEARLNLILADLLADGQENKFYRVETICPWPTEEEWEIFIKTAPEKIIASLERAVSLIPWRSMDYDLPFKIIKIYVKHIKSNAVTKSQILEKMLKSNSLLKGFFEIHANPQTKISDFNALISSLNENNKYSNNNDQVFSLLIDFVEHYLNFNDFESSKQALEKASQFRGPAALTTRRELVRLQLELQENFAIHPSDSKNAESILFKLNTAICKAVNKNGELAVIRSACISAWKTVSSVEETAVLVSGLICILKTISDVSGKQKSFFEAQDRCNLNYKLARCYEYQNIFSLATRHAEKALKLCNIPELANDIEILLHKLWIKANTFDGHLSADLKALSLADQAKYIPEDAVAFQLLQKSLKTLVLVPEDHDLISPAEITERNDFVQSLLKNDCNVNFDLTHTADLKSKRIILVALSDIMRQSKYLAERANSSLSRQRIKYWKMVWDSSRYLMTLEIENLTDKTSSQRLRAEALLNEGTSLFEFQSINPTIELEESSTENLSSIHKPVIDLLCQSLTIGITLKDLSIIQNVSQKICNYFSGIKPWLNTISLAFWTETFQKLFDTLTESNLLETDLMVRICIGYATVMKESQIQATIAAALAATGAAEDKLLVGTKGGKGSRAASVSKPKGKQLAPSKVQAAPNKQQQNTLSTTGTNKTTTAEEIFNTGLSAKDGSYAMKLILFDIKTAMKISTPLNLSNTTDPAMKIFSALDLLEMKKPSNDELEHASQTLSKYGKKLGKTLYMELMLRIIQHAFNQQHMHLAFLIMQTLSEEVPKEFVLAELLALDSGINVKLIIQTKQLFSQIILAMIEQQLYFDSFLLMKQSALKYLSQCLEITCTWKFAEISDVETTLDILRKTIFGIAPQWLFLHNIESTLSTLYSAYFAKVSIQNLIAKKPEVQDTILQLTEVCLDIYCEKGDWNSSSRIIDRSGRILPKKYHESLLRRKVQVLSTGNKPGIAILLKEVDPRVQYDIWKMLTEFANTPEKKRQAFEECLKVTKDLIDFREKFIETQMLFSRWLLDNESERKYAVSLIRASFTVAQQSLVENNTVPNQILVFESNILAAEVEISQKRKLELLNIAFDLILKLVEPISNSQLISAASSREKPVSESAKSRATTPLDRPLSSVGGKNLESWMGFDWPQDATCAFINGTISNALCLASIKNTRQFISSIISLIFEFEELGELLNCIPLFSVVYMILSTCFEPEEIAFTLSAIYIYNALVLSKLFRFELAAKYRRLYFATEDSFESLKSSWNDKYNGCDIGYSLSRNNILLLKANCLIQYGQLAKARNILYGSILPTEKFFQEAYYLGTLISCICDSTSFDIDIFVIEDRQQAEIFAKFLDKLVETQSLKILNASAMKLIPLIKKSVSLLGENNQKNEFTLWNSQHKILISSFQDNENSTEEKDLIQQTFQECLNLTTVLEFWFNQADLMLLHAKFVKITAIKKIGRDLMKALLSALELLRTCRKFCNSKKISEKSQNKVDSWNNIEYSVILEECNLLLQIAHSGSAMIVQPRTISVMIDDYFIPEGEKSLTKRWEIAQEYAIEEIISSLAPAVAYLPAALKAQGKQFLALAYKKKYAKIKEFDTESSNAILNECISQFSKSMTLAFQQARPDIVKICAENLLLCDWQSDMFVRYLYLANFQCCDNWEFLMGQFKQLNHKPETLLMQGTVKESETRNCMNLEQNSAYQRTLAFPVTPEILIDVPKNVKVLTIHHSLDKSQIFSSVLYRIKDANTSKSKNPIEDFFISSLNFKADAALLDNLQSKQNSPLDLEYIEEIYKYLEPILKHLEVEGKVVEKLDQKKKSLKSQAEQTELIDLGHCIICCDDMLDLFPLEAVLRVKRLAATCSREFGKLHQISDLVNLKYMWKFQGLSYFLTRLKTSPSYTNDTGGIAKKEKAAVQQKWQISSIKTFSSFHIDASSYFGDNVIYRSELTIGAINCNELSTCMETGADL